MLLLTAFMLALTGAPAAVQDSGPQRSASDAVARGSTDANRAVVGNTVISDRDPRVEIEIPRTSRYIGADRWVLYGYDDVELHVFVEPDDDNRVKTLHWVQFESYIPERPELSHAGHYDSSRRISVGGIEFHLDTWVRSATDVAPAGSDLEHVDALVQDKGYRAPSDAMYVRLVHLPDAEKRKELMIIYVEDLAPLGFSAAELDEHGASHDRWPEIERSLVERAVGSLTIRK